MPFKRMTWKASLLTTLVSLLAFTVALAASGDLDTSFSGDGQVTANFGLAPGRQDSVEAIAIQSNGKIVAVGYSYVTSTSSSDFALTRYNPNGTPDTTFSGDGKLITSFGGSEGISNVAVQSNGKIVAAGTKCISNLCDVALARYNPNGTLDTTFSADGKVVTDFAGRNNEGGGGLALQSDGKIVVAGYASNGTDDDFAIYRYNPNGTLDTTFSGDGIAIGNFGLGRYDVARDLAIQIDGKIVVVGNSSSDGSYANFDFAIARLNPNGTADTTFSGDGRQTTNFGGPDAAYSLAIQPNGKIVAVGFTDSPTRAYFAIVRYNTNGSLDTTFNGTGKKAFSVIPGSDSWAFDVIVRSDGKIVMLGSMDNGGSLDFALVRLNSVGSFDTTFSGDGKVIVDFGGNDNGSALALQSFDGKYVLGGSTDAGTGGIDFALARVLP